MKPMKLLLGFRPSVFFRVSALGFRLSVLALCSTTLAASDSTLWYAQPAEKWVEALPIGNGRLGGMVFGGVTKEHLPFNADTLWTGQPHEYQHERGVKFLPQIAPRLARGQ